MEDLHIHTYVSKDCKESPEKYIISAIKSGVKYLGFSDHLDLDPTDKDFGYYKFNRAYKDYLLLKKKYQGKLNLLFGVEVTYQSGLEKSIERNTKGKPYDYLMGAIHRLGGYTIAGLRGVGFFEDKDEETAYRMYFEELYRMVNTDFFQIVAHFDVVKRYGMQFYGKFKAGKYKNVIESILDRMIQKGIVMEVNSSGFRQIPEEPYPSEEILSMYAVLGGREITVGSDAHNIEQFGNDIKKALDVAKRIYNFDIVTFTKKKKIKLGKISSM